MAKSWLDVQVDLELANFHPSRLENKHYGDDVNGSSVLGGRTSLPSAGPECWPAHVLDQQPRDISALLQKLHSE